MEVTLSDGTNVVLWDNDEMPMKATRVIERTTAKVDKAVERMRQLANVPSEIETREWWMGLSSLEREDVYQEMTEQEQDDMEAAQDSLIAAVVISWSRDYELTKENVSELPGPLYLELAQKCNTAAGGRPDFSNEDADNTKAPTANS
jgi:ClpP class serine protease